MRKTPVTGYGFIGSDMVRATIAWQGDDVVVVKADGTDAVLNTLPRTWRTSGDVVSVAATTGTALNMAAMAIAAVPAHGHRAKSRKASGTYKAERTLRQFVLHMTKDAALTNILVAGLEKTYSAE